MTKINQKWSIDFRYIHTTKNGWTYLVSVKEFHSKKIIGYAYGIKITAEIAVKALQKASINTKFTEHDTS